MNLHFALQSEAEAKALALSAEHAPEYFSVFAPAAQAVPPLYVVAAGPGAASHDGVKLIARFRHGRKWIVV